MINFSNKITQTIFNINKKNIYTKDKVWTISEMQQEFYVHTVIEPYVMVTNKITGKQGTLMYKHNPRIYFNFVED